VKYTGKVDWWIGFAALAGIALPIVAAIPSQRYWMLAAPAIFALFMLIWCYPQTYQTTDDALHIRSGLTKRVIPWSGITSVSTSSESGSSLALSLDRVAIQHAAGTIMIAPDDQVGFFDDVASHCPSFRGVVWILSSR
jgi:membrane protein YdbS with pleckstrin-like domain